MSGTETSCVFVFREKVKLQQEITETEEAIRNRRTDIEVCRCTAYLETIVNCDINCDQIRAF